MMSRRFLCGFAMFLSAFGPAEWARAARFAPRPLLAQLEAGYGVVAAVVVKTSRVSAEGKYPGFDDVVFKIHAVPAQPVDAPPFPLRPGDEFTVRLSVGYACQIEQQSLEPGQKYFLILRHEKDGAYAHADGASAPRNVAAFTTADLELYAQARELVAIPKTQRSGKWLDCIKDAKAPEKLREEAIWGLQTYVWPGSKLDPAETQRTIAALRATWSDPSSHLSIDLLDALDYLLRSTGRDFDKSIDRANGWLVHLFAPTPELRKDDNNRDNLAMFRLQELMADHPQETGQRLIVEMFNPNWPPMYRRAISAAVMTGYCRAETPDPSWGPALQMYYSTGLLHESEPFALRMMAVDILSGLKMPNSARKFVANAQVRAGLAQAIGRLSSVPRKGPNDIEPTVAISDCQAALRALGN